MSLALPKLIMKTETALKAMLATLILTLGSGCADALSRNIPKAPKSSYATASISSISLSGTQESGFNCPSSPNILPDYDWEFDGSGQYTVCPSSQSPADIVIHGRTSVSDVIWVYPAEVVDRDHVYLKPDATGIMVKKADLSASPSGVRLSFPSTNFNAVFIVEDPQHQQMDACLLGGNYYFCPAYSFGKFR